MNSLTIFTNALQLQITIAGLVFFIVCGLFFWNNQSKSGTLSGVLYLVLALVVDFFSIWFENNIEAFSSFVPLNILMVAELLMRLAIMILLAIAATNIMSGRFAGGFFIGLVAVAGAAAVIYFSIVAPDGMIVNVFHNLFPAVGFAYLTAAFFTRCFRRHNMGYLTCCGVSVLITTVVAMNISSIGGFATQIWYAGVCGYVGLGIGVLLLLVDTQADNLDKAWQKINKYDQRIKEMIKLSPFPIVIARLSDDSILSVNDNFLKLFGLKAKDINAYRFRDFFVDADNRRLLNIHLEQEQVIQDFEILVKSPGSSEPFWLSTSANIIDYDYNPALYAAFQDITDRKKREDLLQNQATRDPLTSLYNRRYFEEEVNRRIQAKPDEIFSVFMIDADHFKRVNDTYGHKVGDKVLMALASTAEKALRENDIVARYGGEEFVVYLAQSNAAEAKSVADRLRESISQIVVYSDAKEPIKFTVSIGIACAQNTKDINKLIKMSDDALYKAKEGGRNRCEVYDEGITAEPQAQKKGKAAENVHPAFAKNNNVEISILNGNASDGGDVGK